MNGNDQRQDDNGEWDLLEGLWRDVPVDGRIPGELRKRVRREEWRLRAYALSEWLLAAVFMIVGIRELATFTTPREFLLGFLLVFLTCVAVSFSMKLRRGLWVPSAENTQAYLEISRARIRAGWRVLRYTWLLFGLQSLLLAGIEVAGHLQLIGDQWRGEYPVFLLVFLGIFGLVLAAWSRWYARTLRRREAVLLAARRELDAETVEASSL